MLNIDASYDGTWMKRGHTPLVGMGVIIEVCKRFIFDFEVMCKYCHACEMKEKPLKKKKITEEDFKTRWLNRKSKCSINCHGTSGGMKAEGAVRMCQR